MLRAQKEERLGDNELTNIKVLTDLWTEEVLKSNHEIENQTVQAENFDYFFGPQLSPVCAVVGGLAGQEAIKAMSENERPLQNIFIYSALDSTAMLRPVNYFDRSTVYVNVLDVVAICVEQIRNSGSEMGLRMTMGHPMTIMAGNIVYEIF
ncbi:unnamed protein product [Strongylus vulgaris]|uniref:THIF-type NAD/FAD binding fold domain-containing protein n=1 Tax=Strongylus vulgaris TaxID=40348 RepID=A0A3P7IAW8_STRVU|nr:unnamed protein product [Strongylus vulgaris]